jgi:RNA polymerase sigma-70 factor (ECF subfamily)
MITNEKLAEEFLNPKLKSIIFWILKNNEDTEDCIQQSYASAHAALPQFRGGSTLSTWAHQIAKNKAINMLRARKYKVSIETQDEDGHVNPILIAKDDVAKNVANSELGKKIEAAIAKLSAEHRKVFILAEVEERTFEEVSGITGAPVATCRTRLHYAKKQLQGILLDCR